MMEKFFQIVGVLAATLFGVLAAGWVLATVAVWSNQSQRIEACVREHNVYRCELIAVPAPSPKQETTE